LPLGFLSRITRPNVHYHSLNCIVFHSDIHNPNITIQKHPPFDMQFIFSNFPRYILILPYIVIKIINELFSQVVKITNKSYLLVILTTWFLL